jgi:phage baseplate assembly protein V
LSDRLEIAIKDLQRRLENLIRVAPVIEVDADRSRVKVRFSDGNPERGILPTDSDWLRVLVDRAASTIDYDMPDVGEQIMIFSPGGEIAGGYVGWAIYSVANPSPSKNPKVRLRRHADGMEVAYDSESHTLRISKQEALKVEVTGAAGVVFETEKAAIKNKAGDEVISLISTGFKKIAESKTATMMGSQPLIQAATELPKVTTKLDSFGG